MRRCHFTACASNVTEALCRLVVQHLCLTDYKQSVPALLLARLLLLAACLRRSLSYVAQRCEQSPSEETVRKALLHNLPGTALLQARLLQSLHALLPGCLRRRPQPAALDLHQRPFYGDKDTPGLRGGASECGTRSFWTYATLALIVRGQRYTVGLTPVVTGQPLDQVVGQLLAQARQAGVRLRYLLLDRGFYDAAVIDCLQRHGVRFVMPMIRRGRADCGSGTTPFFRADRPSGWSTYSWTARPRRWDEASGRRRKGPALTVKVSVCVWARAGQRPWVFVGWGIAWPPPQVVRRYRGRFGIETSYRQVGQVLGATTSTDERVRLLLLGLALLLRQGWCLLAEGGPPRGRGQALRLAELAVWVSSELMLRLRFRRELTTQPPDPPPRTAA